MAVSQLRSLLIPGQLDDCRVSSRPFLPEERPLFPGAPFAPLQSPTRRAIYAALGLLLGLLINLGNGILLANVAILAGAREDYVPATALLSGIYVAFNAASNLVLVKGRIQFGIPRLTIVMLAAYALAALLLYMVPVPASAILLSAVSGMTSAGLTTITIYYFMQSLKGPAKPLGLLIGVSVVQLGSPLSRLLPVDILSIGGWPAFALIQLAISLLCLVIIVGYPLPPTERTKAFEPLDIVTFLLFLTANLLLCSVLVEARLLWWTDTPWIGWAIAGCIPLYAGALLVEMHRTNPLLRLSWYGTPTIATFAAIAVVVRLALSEQSYGSVGLISAAGLNNDQFHALYLSIMGAELLGIVAAVLTTRPNSQGYQVMAASLIIALGSWLDTGSNNLTRPENLLLSQSLIAFGTTFFIGPALLYGAGEMLKRGATYLVSLVVMFNMTQNIGGLAGSALLGTYQIARAKYYATALSGEMLASNPVVVERIQQGAGALAGTITDPAQRAAQGAGLLGQSLSREAAILGFNDSFRLVAFVALSAALYLAGAIIWRRWQNRRQALEGARP